MNELDIRNLREPIKQWDFSCKNGDNVCLALSRVHLGGRFYDHHLTLWVNDSEVKNDIIVGEDTADERYLLMCETLTLTLSALFP